MIYTQNLPAWERATRLVAACTMAACGLYLRGNAAGWVLLGLAAATLLTGVFAFCPSCALAGRNPMAGKEQA